MTNALQNRMTLQAPGLLLVMAMLTVGATGCPVITSNPFDLGFDEGFAEDDEYFAGYDDSLQTVGFAPILYRGGEIPFIDDHSFDAGFYDGVFQAYNDGYFVAYTTAFVIGFGEGYDSAFWPDYLEFLAADEHIEFKNGGFDDGYFDGFTEGRIFGAFDFEAGLPFDWMDALLDWRGGTDLFFEEVNVGTGVFGPAVLYEYGVDPTLAKRAAVARSGLRSNAMSMRKGANGLDFTRPLTVEQEAVLSVAPETTERGGRELRLTQTRLERIEAYFSGAKTAAVRHRSR